MKQLMEKSNNSEYYFKILAKWTELECTLAISILKICSAPTSSALNKTKEKNDRPLFNVEEKYAGR